MVLEVVTEVVVVRLEPSAPVSVLVVVDEPSSFVPRFCVTVFST